MFKGKVSILGYIIECDLRVNHKNLSFFLDAKFDPIDDWGFGMMFLYAYYIDCFCGQKYFKFLIYFITIYFYNVKKCIKMYTKIMYAYNKN